MLIGEMLKTQNYLINITFDSVQFLCKLCTSIENSRKIVTLMCFIVSKCALKKVDSEAEANFECRGETKLNNDF